MQASRAGAALPRTLLLRPRTCRRGRRARPHAQPPPERRHRRGRLRQAASSLFGGVLLGDAGDPLDDLQHGPERDALAVGKTAAAEHGGGIADHLQRLRDQARLPDTGGAEHGEEVARALTNGAGVRISQEGELALAAHHVRVEAPSMSGCARHHFEQPVRHHPLALSLHDQRLERLGANRSRASSNVSSPIRISPGAAERSRRSATMTTSPLTSMSSARGIAGDHLPAVDAQANLDVGRRASLELDVQRLDRLAEIDGGAEGAQGVVLVHTGTPKTAMTASPMNFSTLPPCRSRVERASS